MSKRIIRNFVIYSIIGLLIFMIIPINTTALEEYIVCGHVYEDDGNLTALEDISINITNLFTEDWTIVNTDEYGYYSYDLADLPGGVAVGHTIRISVLDLLVDYEVAFFDFEVLIGDSTHAQDFTRTIVNDNTVANIALTWNVGISKAVAIDNVRLETDINGKVTFDGGYLFKDTGTGWKTVYWSLVIYRQTNGIITDWDDDNIEEERDQIDSDSGNWYYEAPTDGYVTLDGWKDLMLEYDPPDAVDTTFYMMAYADISRSGTEDNLNVLWYNIPVTVKY